MDKNELVLRVGVDDIGKILPVSDDFDETLKTWTPNKVTIKAINDVDSGIGVTEHESAEIMFESFGVEIAKEIKKEVKTEYFYILYMQNGVHRLAVFGDLGIAKSNVKNWNEKGMKAVVVTGSQLNQLKSSK